MRRLVAQRLSRYEDLNDELRDDSLLALAGDDLTGERRVRARGHPLAGPSALNRRELGVPGEADRYKRADMEAMDDLPVAPFLEALPSPPGKIWLDATGDPLHGNQEDVSSTGTTICRCTSATMWCVFAVAACERRRGGGAGVHGRAGGAVVCCGRASVAQERLICVQTVGSSSLFAGSVSRGTGARAGDASARKSCSVSQEGRRRPSRTIRDSGVPWTRRQRERAAAQARRAIALILEGHSRQDAAEAQNMDRQTLRDWVHRYNEFGGLNDRPKSERKVFLDEGQLKVAGERPGN